jgi:hypothetical protein
LAWSNDVCISLAADARQVGKHFVRRHFLDQQQQSDVSRSAITV